jgi:hypothetical protein
LVWVFPSGNIHEKGTGVQIPDRPAAVSSSKNLQAKLNPLEGFKFEV